MVAVSIETLSQALREREPGNNPAALLRAHAKRCRRFLIFSSVLARSEIQVRIRQQLGGLDRRNLRSAGEFLKALVPTSFGTTVVPCFSVFGL